MVYAISRLLLSDLIGSFFNWLQHDITSNYIKEDQEPQKPQKFFKLANYIKEDQEPQKPKTFFKLIFFSLNVSKEKLRRLVR
jgi:hypothetical protein